ncbi:MAG: sigma 54-interacting transcriptional regulator, partial [Candidatus Binataceae bacterium]
PKLLRAVETHEVQPVGSSRSYHVDIRLVAATNRDLREMVRTGHFRDDLYYRLNAAAIVIPPLRERPDDIEALSAHFVAHYNRLFGKYVRFVSRRALGALFAHRWPGNVRELGHAIESAVMLTDGDRLDRHVVPEHIFEHASAPRHTLTITESPGSEPISAADSVAASEFSPAQLPFSLDEVIKLTLVRSLQETEGNRRRAANLLGISRSTLYRMMARYGLGLEHPRRNASPSSGTESQRTF